MFCEVMDNGLQGCFLIQSVETENGRVQLRKKNNSYGNKICERDHRRQPNYNASSAVAKFLLCTCAKIMKTG